MRTLNIGTEKASIKIKQYCAYQERCHQETSEKLYGYGLYPQEVSMLLAMLIEENYLNEERFAIAYAGGKFRINNWGKNKIKLALRQKQVSDYCIKKGLASIDENNYFNTLKKLADAKWALLKKEKNIFVRKHKLQQYLLQKGYESSFIMDVTSIVSSS
ncbi:MAG: regulatory protein RecX [Ferruginibacter sp.]